MRPFKVDSVEQARALLERDRENFLRGIFVGAIVGIPLGGFGLVAWLIFVVGK